MGLIKLTVLDLRNKVPKIQGPGVGLAIFPLLSLSFFSFFGGIVYVLRGWRVLVFNPGAFINLFGPPICLYYARIFFNPIWTVLRATERPLLQSLIALLCEVPF